MKSRAKANLAEGLVRNISRIPAEHERGRIIEWDGKEIEGTAYLANCMQKYGCRAKKKSQQGNHVRGCRGARRGGWGLKTQF